MGNMPASEDSAIAKHMAKLPDETITIIFNLQRRLLQRIDEASATETIIFELFGEAELIITELEQLQNVRERTRSSYSRLYTLLLRIAESQPVATSATLDLLAQSIEQAEATNASSEATVREIQTDLNLL